MDRREFLLASGSAVLTSATLASLPLGAQTFANSATKGLTLTVADADGVTWTVGQARELARRIEQASRELYSVSLADPANVNAACLKLMPASQLVEIDRAFAFATGLPGSTALDAASVDNWLAAAGGQQALDDLAATHGLKVLLAAHGGEQFLWSTQPYLTASDFAGKCVLADGLACHVAAGLGAEPWRIVRANALASGEVAAMEASIPDAISQGHLQTARYATANVLTPHGHAVALTIHLDAWTAMSRAEQAAISSAARENYAESVRMNSACAAMHRSALQQTHGIGVTNAPHGLAASIQTVARAVIAQAAAGSPAGANLNASYMAYLTHHQDLTVHDRTV